MKKGSKKEKKKSYDYDLDDNNKLAVIDDPKKKKKKKKKHPKLRLFFKIFFIILLILVIAGIAGVVAIFKTDKWALTEAQLLTDNAGATIYDGNSEVMNTLTGDEINKKAALNEMGKLPEAFISIEDERFYNHKGIDIKRTAHAIVDFIVNKGNGSFGGSTITQQLIKITMKDDENSGFAGVERKIREWSRAVQVEKMLEKDQILERYLNRIYLGSSGGLEIRGVEAASIYYFNKSAKDLSLAQTAFIAGMNHSPNSYNPFGEEDNSEKIKTRTLNVIGKMKELGKISEEEYNQAVEETNNGLAFAKGNLTNGNSGLSFHTAAAIDQIAKDLSNEMDISYTEAREMAINSGYSIYTTVDQSIQKKMEEEYALSKYIMQGASANGSGKHEPGQSAMVIIDPSKGWIVGEVGALGENQDTLGLNRGLSERQPGSSFKPLVTIAPGLENKVINASTLFYDTPTRFGTYEPHNDSNSYGGVVSIREAIKKSYNVTEVKLLSILGLSKSQDFLSQIGINVDSDDLGLSMALGAPSLTPVQMAAGFAMIANKGVYITPTFYTKVVDKEGNTVIECTQEKKRVMSEENAYIESTILQGPITAGGTAGGYAGVLGSMDVAGKTGTSDEAADRWFCGFTPYYAAACWYGADNGYDCDGKGTRMSFWGNTNPAAKIWFPVMKKVHEGLAAKKFEQPSEIITLKICRATGKKATGNCTDTYSEIFAKDNQPAECDGHQSLKICKETGKIATEFCPDTETKTYGVVIETEKNGTWSPKQTSGAAPSETCHVHTEPAKIGVPNVVGMSEAEAIKTLKEAGFNVKVEKSNDRNKKKGVVLKQSPTGEAPKGTTITITVNQYNGGSSNGSSSSAGGNSTGGSSGGNSTNGRNTTTGGSTSRNDTD